MNSFPHASAAAANPFPAAPAQASSTAVLSAGINELRLLFKQMIEILDKLRK